jgi:hypothetical protein
MTKNVDAKSKTTGKVKGPSHTPKCTMSGTQIQRFGITKEQNGRGATDFGSFHRSPASARWVKKMTELARTVRQLQGKTDTTVPAPVRSAIKYFSVPFSRDESRSEHRKLSKYEATGADPTKEVLKV